jgi:hypothetical protein
MKCLLCGGTPNSVSRRAEVSDLVAMQEHVMVTHGYSIEQLRTQARKQLGKEHYRYTTPDGVAWLEAWVEGGDPTDLSTSMQDNILLQERHARRSLDE